MLQTEIIPMTSCWTSLVHQSTGSSQTWDGQPTLQPPWTISTQDECLLGSPGEQIPSGRQGEDRQVSQFANILSFPTACGGERTASYWRGSVLSKNRSVCLRSRPGLSVCTCTHGYLIYRLPIHTWDLEHHHIPGQAGLILTNKL